MKIEDIVAVSGLPGLFKIIATRNNGLIVEDVDTQKTRFVSVRKHQFTPLATVAIYTEEDTEEINVVFETIQEKIAAGTNPPSVKASSAELFKYFGEILPNYDRDQVLISDVKKVIKWYNFLIERGLFPFETEENSEEE